MLMGHLYNLILNIIKYIFHLLKFKDFIFKELLKYFKVNSLNLSLNINSNERHIKRNINKLNNS